MPDKLPFDEYARIIDERGAAKYGNPDTPKLTFLAAYFRFAGLGNWQQRLNDTLRKAVIAQQDGPSLD